MKDIFRQLVENTQEEVDVNKKMEEWGQRIEGQASELNMRKFLYLRVSVRVVSLLTLDHRHVPRGIYDVACAVARVHQL